MVEEEPPKPMVEVENIVLIEGDPSKTTKVEKELQQGRIGGVFEKELGCLCMEP